MSSDEETIDDPKPKRKKGVVNEDKYKRNVIKTAKLRGEEHINWSGKLVPAKQPGFNCGCQQKCLEAFTEDEILAVFTRFHDFKSKTEQDIYLQTLMELGPIQRQRHAEGSRSKAKAFTVSYNILINGTRHKVCRNAFMQTYSRSSKQLYRLSHLLQLNITPEDKRGKKSSSNAIPGSVIEKLRAHIESYPTKVSHYTGTEKRFLSANLNVRLMYEAFIEKERLFLSEVLQSEKRLSNKYFWQYFKENYNLGFGRPVKDACVTCEELNNKIKSPFLNDVAKRVAVAELLVHKRRAKQFYKIMKDLTEKIKTESANKKVVTAAICMDYMANVSLPTIPVQDLYYLRQLTVNVFGVHDFCSNKMTCFVYHEGEGGKGSNEVCSWLRWYIENKVNPEIKNLYIFSDNCSGQNKNNSLVRYCMALCELKRFDNIFLIFPMRGHSFMPADRDFGIIRRKLRKEERYYSVPDVINLIQTSSKIKDKFNVVEVHSDQVFDFKNWYPKYYKKSCLSTDSYGKNCPKDKKIVFGISKYHKLSFSSSNPTHVVCCQTMSGLSEDSFKLRNPEKNIELPNTKAYTGKVPINETKMQDIKKAKVYVPADKMDFWNDIITWPTTQNRDPDMDD